MKIRSEARTWQLTGGAVFLIGGAMLSYAFAHYGFASIEAAGLNLGITASFLLLAGVIAFVTGRALAVEYSPMGAREARLWRLLTTVCLIGGIVTVIFAPTQHEMLDRLAIG